jgi:hypothetical protein
MKYEKRKIKRLKQRLLLHSLSPYQGIGNNNKTMHMKVRNIITS